MKNPADSKSGDQPIRAFGRFFRSYGLGISLIVSALPLATRQWDLLPQFEGVKGFLTAIASGSSFLIVGIIFAQRQAAARLFFPGRQAGKTRIAHEHELRRAQLFGWLPAILWIMALCSVVGYFQLVHNAEQALAFQYAVSKTPDGDPSSNCSNLKEDQKSLRLDAVLAAFGGPYDLVITCSRNQSVLAYSVQFPNESVVQAIRRAAPSPSVPHQILMGITFLLTFACAASAFILTGLKDYLQGEMKLSDADLILQPTTASRKQRFDVEGVPGVYGIAEYVPNVSELEPIFTGPLCEWHDLEPKPAKIDPTSGNVTAWQHPGEDKTAIPCELQAVVSVGELDRRFRESGERIVGGVGTLAV